MTINAHKAEHMRKAADHMEEAGRKDVAAHWRREADKCDPPAPTYADGTVAWVTDRMGDRWISVRASSGWQNRSDAEHSGYVGIVKVEPLRVLAADEIAIKRPGYLSRLASEMLRDAEFSTSADLLESIRDALDAESGDAK